MAVTKITTATAERQNVTQLYKSLSASDRIIFKSILEMTIILLKNMQATERSTK